MEEQNKPEEQKKPERAPSYYGKWRLAYKRGYDFGFKDAKRLKERMAKAKVYVQALWNLFRKTKD